MAAVRKVNKFRADKAVKLVAVGGKGRAAVRKADARMPQTVEAFICQYSCPVPGSPFRRFADLKDYIMGEREVRVALRMARDAHLSPRD